MLSAFIALIFIIENVVSQGSRNPFPEETVESFKTLNMRYNNKLTWSDEVAIKALEWLKSPENVKDDVVIIKGKEYFSKTDSKTLWQKVISILEHRFDRRKKEIARLPAGTLFGCNGIIDTKLKKKESIYTACLYMKPQKSAASENSLPKDAEETFKILNSMYSDNVEWSDEWAKKALEWLKSPKSVKADLVIKGQQSFPKDDKKELWEKLLAILEHRFGKKTDEIEGLPEGTMYGCNGVIDTKGGEESIYTACLYKKP
ncbi:hypothetical protein V3C99_016059 [Haemonchus contortus]|uniref:Endo-1,4-beta-xylanase A n=1 Tax=Haemonchus contortus TaxID=6289 RepID=A0A6F7PPJ5_HAECO